MPSIERGAFSGESEGDDRGEYEEGMSRTKPFGPIEKGIVLFTSTAPSACLVRSLWLSSGRVGDDGS